MQQLSLFDDQSATAWSNDDWQTPDNVAQAMTKLVKDSDRTILEPCAGSGQIAKFLPHNRKAICLEVNPDKVKHGTMNAPYCGWINANFFDDSYRLENSFDLIVGNPPFSSCVEFIARSLPLLNIGNSDARILFLLPLDWNCSHGRASHWKKLDAHIHHVHRWEGRISYLDANGVPQKRRQVCDAVFDIRPGKSNAAVSYL